MAAVRNILYDLGALARWARIGFLGVHPILGSSPRRQCQTVAMQETRPDPLEVALAWSKEGRGVALATVIQTWGSAPQPVGSRLAIDSAQNFEGSVSGGCVEGSVISEASEVLETGESRILTFGVSDETAFEAGLACGGTIRIFLESIGGEKGAGNAALYAGVADARAARRPAIMTTRLEDGSHQLLDPGDIDAQAPLADIMLQALSRGQSQIVDSAEGEIFLEVHSPALRLVIIGAVHIAQYLEPMAAAAGYAVTIIDPRQAFATPERFPAARLFPEWPDDVLPDFDLDARTAMLALTHDPKIDDVALKLALGSDCFYIGALGSKRTHAARIERLRDAGFSDALIARIHAPVGLAIGARGPAEIAISIVAELVAALRLAPQATDTI